MNQEVKVLWVGALRSGKYIQGKRRLRMPISKIEHVDDDNTIGVPTLAHCCLAVLCEVYKEVTGNGEWIPRMENDGITPDGDEFSIDDNDFSRSVLPTAVIKWADLEQCNPLVKNPIDAEDKESLARLNDSGLYDFRDIANIIEKDL